MYKNLSQEALCSENVIEDIRKKTYDYCKKYWNDIIELASKGGPHMTPESLTNFIVDVNHITDMGMHFSDSCEIVLELKGYDQEEVHGYDITGTDDIWWDQLLCFCVTEVRPISEEVLFYG